MNLNQWRTDAALIKKSAELQGTETFQAMLGVLESERPVNAPLPRVGASATDHAYNYGQDVGFALCLDVLRGMATHPEEADETVVADFLERNDYYDGK